MLSKQIIVTSKNMTRSITGNKKRGRPPTTGVGTQIGERWHDAELAEIDAWRAAQPEPLSRSEAVRQLVRIGLDAKPKKPKRKS